MENKQLEIKRGKRFVAFIINGLFAGGSSYASQSLQVTVSTLAAIWAILNLVFIFKDHQSIGGKAMGYKWVSRDEEDVNVIKLGLFIFASALLSSITLGIFWIVDIATLQNRNGSFAEKWAGVKKVEA